MRKLPEGFTDKGEPISKIPSAPPEGALMEEAQEGLNVELEMLRWAYLLSGEKDRTVQVQIAMREAMRNVCAEVAALRREIEALKVERGKCCEDMH